MSALMPDPRDAARLDPGATAEKTRATPEPAQSRRRFPLPGLLSWIAIMALAASLAVAAVASSQAGASAQASQTSI